MGTRWGAKRKGPGIRRHLAPATSGFPEIGYRNVVDLPGRNQIQRPSGVLEHVHRDSGTNREVPDGRSGRGEESLPTRNRASTPALSGVRAVRDHDVPGTFGVDIEPGSRRNLVHTRCINGERVIVRDSDLSS